MSIAFDSAGTTPRPARLWRRLRRPGRRRRDALLSGLRLLLNAAFAAMFVLTLRAPAHMRRFIVGALFTSLIVWTVVLAYLVLTPPSYSSRLTFILPTAASGVSLQVESIGHAQTIPSSPFGSSQLSPKVIYKEIILSERVRLAAAESLGMKLGEFGGPTIKLIDETSLILIEMRGRSPEIAQRKAAALIEAFNNQLEELRRDEIRRRAAVVQESLKTYQLNLQAARERILEQQRKTGVLSISQFSEASTSMELMRRRLAEVKADVARITAEQERLIKSIGLDPASAALLIKLAGDPAFNKLATDFGDSNAIYQQDAIRFGPQNPLLQLSRNKANAAYRVLAAAMRNIGDEPQEKVERLMLLLNGSHRAELVRQLVSGNAAVSGKREELKTLEAEFNRLDDEVKRMSTAAARLEDLKKDHLVAEAVFTSALARLDTNKTDIYASYPMVQTLAAPDLPTSKSSPYTLIAIAAGILGSMLSMAAWGMAWLRYMFSQKRSKSASSSGRSSRPGLSG